jgi:predicted AAA+ superfamily ATPase
VIVAVSIAFALTKRIKARNARPRPSRRIPLSAKLQWTGTQINYWRDKQGHEIDFIISRRGKQPIAIECKWQDKNHDLRNIKVFNRHYPQAKIFIVCHDIQTTRKIIKDKLEIEVVNLNELVSILLSPQ